MQAVCAPLWLRHATRDAEMALDERLLCAALGARSAILADAAASPSVPGRPGCGPAGRP